MNYTNNYNVTLDCTCIIYIQYEVMAIFLIAQLVYDKNVD